MYGEPNLVQISPEIAEIHLFMCLQDGGWIYFTPIFVCPWRSTWCA